MRRRWVAFMPLVLLGFIALAILGGFAVSALWNWLIPPIAGWSRISVWQGLGLLALCRILFGGFGGHRGSGWGRRSREDRERWHRKMADRFGEASPPPTVV